MHQKILDYLHGQAVPRTAREIQNATLLTKNQVLIILKEFVDLDEIGILNVDGIPHYFPKPYQQDNTTMKLQAIQAFKAKDGTLFESEEQAIAHNIGIEHGPKIDEFMEFRNLDNKARGMQKSIITKWEIYKASQL